MCQGQFKEFEEKLAAIDADLRYAPTLILHFKITVEAAMMRIQNRAKVEGRWFEKDITEEYLRNLLAKYESLYEGRKDRVWHSCWSFRTAGSPRWAGRPRKDKKGLGIRGRWRKALETPRRLSAAAMGGVGGGRVICRLLGVKIGVGNVQKTL